MPTGVGLTALAMAAVRASESRRPDRLFDDPFAEDFLSTAGPVVALEANSALWAWLTSWLPVRTRFFDDYLMEACAAGCLQVVVLAAGLDARAFRFAWPQGVRLFELDLPEVLAFKESVLATRGATPACHREVISADLRENWPQGLVQAGFRVDEPTAWLAEGLLVYLSAEEKDRLVDQVGQLSASGSRLGVSYAGRTAGLAQASGGSPGDALFRTLRRSDYDEDPQSWLARHGWCAHCYDLAGHAEFYGRPLSAVLDRAAAEAARRCSGRHARSTAGSCSPRPTSRQCNLRPGRGHQPRVGQAGRSRNQN